MAEWIVCGLCGAIVADAAKHSAWHTAKGI